MTANWITNGTAAPFYARRTFFLPKEVRYAEACVCGLGQFHFYLNGRKISDHELDPGWTDYRKYIEYVRFEITDQLRPGENVLGVEVGNGWYHKTNDHYTFQLAPFMPPNPNPYRPFGSCLVLALELKVVYVDGTEDRLSTDEGFRTCPHPVTMSNVYGSETIDARLYQPGWSAPGFDDRGWTPALVVPEEERPAGQLVAQMQPPVRVIARYEGRYLHTVNGRRIYDFGQNMAGILAFSLRGRTGDMVRLYPAEKLDAAGDADQVAKDWCTVDSCVTAIVGADNVRQDFRMKFTYFAGRYVAVEAPEEVEVEALWAEAITSAWKTDGSFRCDDHRFEQIYSLVEKAVEANMVSVHTDCPTIERFAWQEPNHLMAPSIFFMKDSRSLWEKFLLDIRMAQHKGTDAFRNYDGSPLYPGEGCVPAQCPCYIPNVIPVPGMGSFYDIVPWGSTCILGAWWHYWFYGDKRILEENYDTGMRYLAHLKRRRDPDGFLNYGLGDWGNPRQELCRENVETAFLYADTVTLARMAALIGRDQDRQALLSFAEEVKDNYNRKLLVRRPGGWCYRAWDHPGEILMTQAAQALPLYWGMVPEDRQADVAAALIETLHRDGAFLCGEISLPYVIQTAREYGQNDLIAQFILRQEHPSYYAFVLDGETTLGEYWEHNPRSHCHDMMGHIIEWYFNGIAGLQPEEAGFARVTIQPFLPNSMRHFCCTYHSVRGAFLVEVTLDENEVCRVSLQIPRGVSYSLDTSLLSARSRQVITEVRQGNGTEEV